jgi:hypothetical protein
MADGPSVGRGDRRRPRARRHAPARNLTTNGHVTGNPQSKQAENLFQQRFPPDKNAVDELIVVRSAAHTVNDPRSSPASVPRRPQRGSSPGTPPSASPATGTPQSLGCVELPLASAAKVWPYTPIGTLVTVED